MGKNIYKAMTKTLVNNQSNLNPLDTLLKLKINHSKVKEVSKLDGNGDYKFHLVCDNHQEYLLRAFDVHQYALHVGKEEYNYNTQYHLLKWLHQFTSNIPTAFKPFKLKSLHWYCLLLEWMPGISLNQVVLINWDEIEYLADQIKDLVSLVHKYHFKNANKYHHKHRFIQDRKSRLFNLAWNYYSQIAIDQNKKHIFYLLTHQLKHYWANLCFTKYAMNHGDLNFLNLLYNLDNEEVNLIDFNRCGFEPNYQDLVKLYFFSFNKAPRLVKQVLTSFIHNLTQWKIFKGLVILFCLTSWQWAFAHQAKTGTLEFFTKQINDVIKDFKEFKLLVPYTMR